MANFTVQTLFLFLSLQTLILLLSLSISPLSVRAQSSSTPSCVSKLTSCVDYLNSTHPPESCCSPLKDAITNELACLCAVYESPSILKAFGINLADANKLAQNCGITNSSTNQCTAAAPSGTPLPPPPTSGSAGERTVWIGILSGSISFLILWSIW